MLACDSLVDLAMADDCCATQLIDGNGNFNAAGLDDFMKKVKLAHCGLSYAVVAIMGPQSSGKFSVSLLSNSSLLVELMRDSSTHSNCSGESFNGCF